MLIFVLHSTSDDRPGWLTDLNPICHPSPARKMKCLFLDYIQILMIGWAGWWTQTPSATPLQPKKWNDFWTQLLNPIANHLPPLSPAKKIEPHLNLSPAKKMKISFLDYVQLLMISRVGWWTQTPFATPLLQKNEILIFGLRSTSDDWQGWSLDSNPMHHPSPTNKMKCLFLYYVQLLMIGLAAWWTQTPSAISPAK